MLHLLLLFLAPGEIFVNRDNVLIRESCRVRVVDKPIADTDGNGVIHVVGNDIVVDFAGARLRGSDEKDAADRFQGIGILVSGRDVKIRGAAVAGFKCGIRVVRADGATIEDCDVSGNFRQRLRSTPQAEDSGDWLWPHSNDAGEWRDRYGAGICVEDSARVTVRRCRARRGQNGLILDRAVAATVYDNDFSFLSGWGIAMWRCRDSLISRNALDFCIRGYSHGVYNRGQDSAGVLMFEQNVGNFIVENSATHGGDGFFAFSGREALGEDWLERMRKTTESQLCREGLTPEQIDAQIEVTESVAARHRGLGNAHNTIARNDFSFAAAHGLELTFGIANRILENRLCGNAICGIWGGYSKQTEIRGNSIERNGDAGYGLERGGVNIEHGRFNVIEANRFLGNRVGVHLWTDADEGMRKLPWVVANGAGSADTRIADNSFDGDEIGIQLRDCDRIQISGNRLKDVRKEVESGPSPATSPAGEGSWPMNSPASRNARDAVGASRPVGARGHLAGRDRIIMTEWGPYDWESPLLRHVRDENGVRVYEVLKSDGPVRAEVTGDLRVECGEMNGEGRAEVRLTSSRSGRAVPYELSVHAGGAPLRDRGCLVNAIWQVRFFNYKSDPREAYDTWKAESASGIAVQLPSLELAFGGRGPAQLRGGPMALADSGVGSDRFGTLAATRLTLPPGRWRIDTLSDDGIRVSIDGKRVIDDWTWHGPTVHAATFVQERESEVHIEVEHFELDGHAVLTVRIAPEP